MMQKTGRPRYEPTEKDRAQVAMLAGMGIPREDIAKVMQISAPTLRRRFAKELQVGLIQANAKVAQSLFKQATDATKPNVVAAIFWLKARAGWRDKDVSLVPADEPEVGKKEQANRAAVTAAEGTEWADLLPSNVSPLRKAG